MTISNTSRTAGPFSGNGITKQFPFSFKVFTRSDLLVACTVISTSIETILLLDADYTVVLNQSQNSSPGGVITLVSPLPIGSTLAVTSNLPIQQNLDLTNNGGFYPAAINDALDRIVITIQQLSAKVGLGSLNVGSAATIAAILNSLTNLATGAGSSIIGFIQSGLGAIVRSLQEKNREHLSVGDFGAVPGVGEDQGARIAAAHAEAQKLGKALDFHGIYTVGPAWSFTIDPLKTRWRGHGPAGLRWTSAPSAGLGINIVCGEADAYETGRNMIADVLEDFQILGSTSYVTNLVATGLRWGNGVNHTYGVGVKNVTISGWTVCEEYTNNVWWVTHYKPRFMWGDIKTPEAFGNWGESITYHDPHLLDGVLATFNWGEFRFFGGSLDNSKIVVKNIAMVGWDSPHFENPGQVTLIQNYVDVQGAESSCVLTGLQMIVNNNGTAITQSPFRVAPANKNLGLIINGWQYTQGGHAQWYSLVEGGGRVRATGLLPLAFENFNHQVVAENMRGMLANYGFESGDMSGWTVVANNSFGTVGSATASTLRTRPGSTGTKSCMMTVTKTADVFGDITISQMEPIRAGEMLHIAMAYSRQYTSLNAQFAILISWINDAGTFVYSEGTGYIANNLGTDDSTTVLATRYNGRAPGGTVKANVQITLQSLTGIGTANLFTDDIFVNVTD